MIVYRTFSLIQNVIYFLFKIACTLGGIIALSHYSENPVITVIAATICLLLILFVGADEIIVYSDKVLYISGGLVDIFKKNQSFEISDIQSINIDGSFSTANELNNPAFVRERISNECKITMKNGQVKILRTNIYLQKLNKVKQEIDKLIYK